MQSVRFAPRKNDDYLQRQSGGRWRYRRHVPKKWRPVVGASYWVECFGRIDRNEAVQRARLLANEHEALIAHFERIGFDAAKAASSEAAKQERISKLRELAAQAQEHAAKTAPDPYESLRRRMEIDTLLSRELRALGWTLPDEDGTRWAMDFMRLGIGGAEAAGDHDERDLTKLRLSEAEEEIAKAKAIGQGRTLLTAMEQWRAIRRQKDSGWRKHVEHINAFVDFLGEDKPLVHVSRSDVERFIDHISSGKKKNGEPLKATTIQAYKATITAYFNWAAGKADWGVTNPAEHVQTPRDDRLDEEQTFDSFDDDQAMEFYHFAKTRWADFNHAPGRGRDLTLALELIMALGIRPGEACQLHVLNILEDDPDGPVLALSVRNVKQADPEWRGSLKTSHSVRQIPVPDALAERVLAQKRLAVQAGNRLLFPSWGHRKKYGRALEREATTVIKPKMSFRDDERLALYSHRHRFRDLSTLVEMPADPFAAIFGHADDNRMTGRYGGRNKWNGLKRKWLNRVYPSVFKGA